MAIYEMCNHTDECECEVARLRVELEQLMKVAEDMVNIARIGLANSVDVEGAHCALADIWRLWEEKYGEGE